MLSMAQRRDRKKGQGQGLRGNVWQYYDQYQWYHHDYHYTNMISMMIVMIFRKEKRQVRGVGCLKSSRSSGNDNVNDVIMMTMITMSILIMTDERHLRCILCEFVLHTLIDQHDHWSLMMKEGEEKKMKNENTKKKSIFSNFSQEISQTILHWVLICCGRK